MRNFRLGYSREFLYQNLIDRRTILTAIAIDNKRCFKINSDVMRQCNASTVSLYEFQAKEKYFFNFIFLITHPEMSRISSKNVLLCYFYHPSYSPDTRYLIKAFFDTHFHMRYRANTLLTSCGNPDGISSPAGGFSSFNPSA